MSYDPEGMDGPDPVAKPPMFCEGCNLNVKICRCRYGALREKRANPFYEAARELGWLAALPIPPEPPPTWPLVFLGAAVRLAFERATTPAEIQVCRGALLEWT